MPPGVVASDNFSFSATYVINHAGISLARKRYANHVRVAVSPVPGGHVPGRGAVFSVRPQPVARRPDRRLRLRRRYLERAGRRWHRRPPHRHGRRGTATALLARRPVHRLQLQPGGQRGRVCHARGRRPHHPPHLARGRRPGGFLVVGLAHDLLHLRPVQRFHGLRRERRRRHPPAADGALLHHRPRRRGASAERRVLLHRQLGELPLRQPQALPGRLQPGHQVVGPEDRRIQGPYHLARQGLPAHLRPGGHPLFRLRRGERRVQPVPPGGREEGGPDPLRHVAPHAPGQRGRPPGGLREGLPALDLRRGPAGVPPAVHRGVPEQSPAPRTGVQGGGQSHGVRRVSRRQEAGVHLAGPAVRFGHQGEARPRDVHPARGPGDGGRLAGRQPDAPVQPDRRRLAQLVPDRRRWQVEGGGTHLRPPVQPRPVVQRRAHPGGLPERPERGPAHGPEGLQEPHPRDGRAVGLRQQHAALLPRRPLRRLHRLPQFRAGHPHPQFGRRKDDQPDEHRRDGSRTLLVPGRQGPVLHCQPPRAAVPPGRRRRAHLAAAAGKIRPRLPLG